MDSKYVIEKIMHTMTKCKHDYNATKIQKLLYIVYGIYLAKFNQILFWDDSPSYLPYGPVFYKTLNRFKDDMFNENSSGYTDDDLEESDIKEIDSVIDLVVNTFGKYTAKSLSDWSHRKGSAWAACEEKDFDYHDKIELTDIRNEFLGMVQQN